MVQAVITTKRPVSSCHQKEVLHVQLLGLLEMVPAAEDLFEEVLPGLPGTSSRSTLTSPGTFFLFLSVPGGYIVRVETWNVGSSLTGGYRLRMIREYTVNLPMPFSYKQKVDQLPESLPSQP